jgi:L-asparaginase
MKPRILVVFTGGTFSMRFDKETGGDKPRLGGDELMTLMPEIAELADVTPLDFGKYPGPHMTPALMFDLSKRVRGELERNRYSGVVITHGTDTLEETAYLLDLTLATDVPVVVTGSMRSSSEPDWDGPSNVADSIRVCLNPNCRGIGVLVCLNGEINAAGEVTKTHTEDIETFHSLDFGALGFVQRGRVVLNRPPRKLETIQPDKIADYVPLIKSYAGMDDRFIRYAVDTGAEGLVIEGMGVGNVPPKAFKGIEYARENGVPVALVSRCPAGETVDIYSYEGAGKWLRLLGVLFAEYLNGQKARVKMILALGKTRDREELRAMFEEEDSPLPPPPKELFQ